LSGYVPDLQFNGHMGLIGLGDIYVLDGELRADGGLVVRSEESVGEAGNDRGLSNCTLLTPQF